MYAGIDFGTSNSSIGVWEKDKPMILPLEGVNTRLPSVLYATRSMAKIEAIDESELIIRTTKAKKEQAKQSKKTKKEGGTTKELTDSELKNAERRLMRSEIEDRLMRAYKGQTIGDQIDIGGDVFFGEQAILRHIRDPEDGFFIKSPKSFLGADLSVGQGLTFEKIVTSILAFIKNKAEQHRNEEIDNIVLGRPVNFHGTRGDEGNSQALGMLKRSSIAAGYKNVEFLMEPVAAALDFERGLKGIGYAAMAMGIPTAQHRSIALSLLA